MRDKVTSYNKDFSNRKVLKRHGKVYVINPNHPKFKKSQNEKV